jgi:hypothetical protein
MDKGTKQWVKLTVDKLGRTATVAAVDDPAGWKTRQNENVICYSLIRSE